MITKDQLEEAFPGEDTESAWKVLQVFDKYKLRYFNKEKMMLEVLDSILHTCGVEYIAHKDDTRHEQLGLSYLNTGDGYVPTVIYDHKKDKWLIGWADLVEAHPSWYQ